MKSGKFEEGTHEEEDGVKKNKVSGKKRHVIGWCHHHRLLIGPCVCVCVCVQRVCNVCNVCNDWHVIDQSMMNEWITVDDIVDGGDPSTTSTTTAKRIPAIPQL